MIKLGEKKYLVGVDNGYQFVKTSSLLFENGIREMSVEPSIKDHTMRINGRFYKVGEGRAGLSRDKVSDEANMKDEYCIVDIGSKTIDVVMVKDGIPNETRSTTIETALIKWMKHIQGELQSRYAKSVPESEILKVMLGRETRIQKEYKMAICEMLTEFMDMVERELMERDIDPSLVKIIYVGGGATIAKNFSRLYRENVAYDCDICANAKGYEFLAEKIIERQ